MFDEDNRTTAGNPPIAQDGILHGKITPDRSFQGIIFRSVDIDGGFSCKDENLRRTAPSGDIHTEVITAHCGDDDNKEGNVTMICDKFMDEIMCNKYEACLLIILHKKKISISN